MADSGNVEVGSGPNDGIGTLNIQNFGTLTVGTAMEVGHGILGDGYGNVNVVRDARLTTTGTTLANFGSILVDDNAGWLFNSSIELKCKLTVSDFGYVQSGNSMSQIELIGSNSELGGDSFVDSNVSSLSGTVTVAPGTAGDPFARLIVNGNFNGTGNFNLSVNASNGFSDPAQESSPLYVSGTLSLSGTFANKVTVASFDTFAVGDVIPLMIAHTVTGSFSDWGWGAANPGGLTLPALSAGHWELDKVAATLDFTDPSGFVYGGDDWLICLTAVP